ncbi:P-loop containing nucleoside triphosphate hydrolase protein [Lyophyllum atratum]|nr:P-loop containing nucleoside triphosphate hydrolase protein [Lyophyllum atratum]
MFSFVSFVLIFALVSRGMAFNITVGKQVLTTSQMLDVPKSVVKTACATNCTTASSLLQSCSDDARCLCKTETVAALLNCEQCMFTKLVEVNQKLDFRVGSASVLSAYAATCKKEANITLAANQTSLKLPSTWDGPFVAILPVGGAVVAVITAGFLGISAIFLLSNISPVEAPVALFVVALAFFSQTTVRAAARNAADKVIVPKRSLKSRHHDTYLGIRNFFLAAAFTRPRVSAKLTAAEEEWLQEDQLQTTSNIPPHPLDPQQSQERFDWRLRASSRIRKPPATPDSQPAPRQKYIRRKVPPVVSVQQGEPFYDAIHNYEDRFLKLLAAEQADAEAVLQERLSSWTLNRLKEEGYCLTDLSAYWLQENQFGRPIASFALGPGLALPDHRFENGTQVLISRIDPLLEGDKVIKGSVVSSTSSQIKVSFADMFNVDDGQWRLDVGRSNIIYERMREAIGHLHQDPQVLEAASTADPQPVLVGTHLRDVLLRTFEPSEEPHEHVGVQAPDDVAYLPHEELEHVGKSLTGASDFGAFKDDMRIQSWARRYAEVDPVVVEGDPVLEGLNDTQRRAVATMIGQRICLVQGPPGTGKTKTIIEAVKLLKVHFEVPQAILVCTYTNVAVDNLVEGLISCGVKALRVGSGSNVRSSLIQHTLDHKLESHPLAPALLRLIKEEEQLNVKLDDLKSRLLDVAKQKTIRMQQKAANMTRALLAMEASLGTLRSRKYAMRQEMLRDVISAADVICTTCITSACVALKVVDLPVVFLDEASMSTEPASLIPIMKGSRHVALIGDHKQLPPVITSPEAQALGLGLSLFERLTQEGVVPSVMLDTQYRMHPAISRFPSSEFYNHTLQDGTVDDVGNVHSRLSPPSSQHLQANVVTGNRPSVIFIDHKGAESMKERSRVNLNEAHIVASIVEDLLLNNPQLMGRDIGIIAPYVAQISLMTRLFNRDAKYRQRFCDVLGDQRAMQVANVEIKTVDGFEGREKEVIIFSTVRNNSGGYIGFLADRRRLNVGLTRARRGLFVVGNLTTLEAGKRSQKEKEGVVGVGKGADSWRRYAKYLAEQGLVIKLEGDSLGQALYGNLNAARAVVRVAATA